MRAEREDVGTRVGWRALHLFGRHVLQRADDRALCRGRPGRGREHRERLPGRADGVLREAEVEKLGARRREHDVAGLQIPMDDALPVCRLERVRDLDAEAEDLASGSGPRSRRAASVSPSSSSSTRYSVSCSRPMSYSPQICG